MRVLIGVVTCHKFTERANAQRRTWVPDAITAGVDVRFVVGNCRCEACGGEDDIPHSYVGSDMLQFSSVPDDYEHLPLKVQAMFAWGAKQEYDFILKTDDDTLVRPQALLKELGDYTGHSNTLYNSGFGYVLSKRAAEFVAAAKWDGDWAEDRWVGGVLREVGIGPQDSPNFILFRNPLGYRCRKHWRASACGSESCLECKGVRQSSVVVCPYDAPHMVEELYKISKEK